MTEERIIAIGDVHGCSAALAALLRAIDPAALDTLVFLGDYIDRGPDSRGVLEQVIALAERCTVVPLLGNHEEMLLAALEGQSELRYWRKFGGTEALASYGYRGGPELRLTDLRALIPSEHLQFIKGCRDYFETVRHIFVHAYYEPDRPLHEQPWGGMRWVSLPPIPKPHCSSKVAIVGHTPQKSGEILDLQLEIKTLLTSKRGAIRQTTAAQSRKLLRMDQGPPPPIRRQWTVAVDHREHFGSNKLEEAPMFPLYIREGTSSFSLNAMHKVETAEDLEKLLNTPPDKLPDKAKAPTSGFYAMWITAAPGRRRQLARQAFKREQERIARRKARSEAGEFLR